jgi:hypothetical protein
VEDVATRRAGGRTAQVRTIAYCGDDGTVAYSMIGPGSNACERIGRSHRSNRVFYIVDFGTGQFCQKCHDPECWGFRSPWMPLPPEAWGRAELAPLLEARTAALMQMVVVGGAPPASGGGAAGGGPEGGVEEEPLPVGTVAESVLEQQEGGGPLLLAGGGDGDVEEEA